MFTGNLCITHSVVQSLTNSWEDERELEISKYITIFFKKRDRENCCNYRPISLLCIVSKVLEPAVLNQIKSEVSPLITLFQHGFRSCRSTETQLIQILHSTPRGKQTWYIKISVKLLILSLTISCYTNWDHLDLMGHFITGFVAMLTIENKELS